MKLKQVEIKNFKCFKELNFPVPENKGFFLLTGKNLDNPRAGANGTGKSTLLDSICWCLYGQTAHGRKAGSLMNQNSKGGYSVSLVFDDHTISRSWKPGSKTIDGVEVEQKAIDDLIGLNFEQFLSTVYFAQEGTHFMNLTPGQKLTFLSGIFQLDQWIACQELCRAKLALNNAELSQVNSKIGNSTEVLTWLEERLVSLYSQRDNWDDERTKRLAALEEQYFKLKGNEPKVTPIDEIKKLSVSITEKHAFAKNAASELDNKRRDLEASARHLDIQVSNFEKEKAKHIDKKGVSCPECGQDVPESRHSEITASWDSKIDTTKSEAETTREKIKRVSDLLALANAEKDKWAEERQKVTEMIQHAQNQQNNLANYTAQLNSLSERCKDVRDAVNPFIDQIDFDGIKKRSELANLESFNKQKLELEQVIERYKFWETRFPQIRLMILDRIVEELDIFFNQAFNKLGMVEYSCKVSTERELKNENIRKELNIKILREKDGVQVEREYEDLSGGEKQRIKIAVDTGISDLIRSQETCRWKDFSMYDELSDNLSTEGMNDLLELMSVISDNQVTLFVDHGVLQESHFDGVFTFVKDKSENSYLVDGVVS